MDKYLIIKVKIKITATKPRILFVSVRPLIEVTNQLVGAPTRTNVTLNCRVEASPKPINFWTRDDSKLINKLLFSIYIIIIYTFINTKF